MRVSIGAFRIGGMSFQAECEGVGYNVVDAVETLVAPQSPKCRFNAKMAKHKRDRYVVMMFADLF